MTQRSQVHILPPATHREMQVCETGSRGHREPASDHRSAYLGLLHFVDSHGVVEQALALGRGQAWGIGSGPGGHRTVEASGLGVAELVGDHLADVELAAPRMSGRGYSVCDEMKFLTLGPWCVQKGFMR